MNIEIVTNDNVKSMIFDTDIIIPVLPAVARREESTHCIAYSCSLFSLPIFFSVPPRSSAHLVILTNTFITLKQ